MLQPRFSELIAATRFDEALAEVRALPSSRTTELTDIMQAAEDAGDLAAAEDRVTHAVGFYELAGLGRQIDASLATSGAEGMQRTIAVDRALAKLAKARTLIPRDASTR